MGKKKQKPAPQLGPGTIPTALMLNDVKHIMDLKPRRTGKNNPDPTFYAFVRHVCRSFDDSWLDFMWKLRLDKASAILVRPRAFGIITHLAVLFPLLPPSIRTQVKDSKVDWALLAARNNANHSLRVPSDKDWRAEWGDFLNASRHTTELHVFLDTTYSHRRSGTTEWVNVVTLKILKEFKPRNVPLFPILEELHFVANNDDSLDYLWMLCSSTLRSLAVSFTNGVNDAKVRDVLFKMRQRLPQLLVLRVSGRAFNQPEVRADLWTTVTALKLVEFSAQGLILNFSSLQSLSMVPSIRRLGWRGDMNAEDHYQPRLQGPFDQEFKRESLKLELPMGDLIHLLQTESKMIRDLEILTYLTSVTELGQLCICIRKVAPELRHLKLTLYDPRPVLPRAAVPVALDPPTPITEGMNLTEAERRIMVWELEQADAHQFRIGKVGHIKPEEKMFEQELMPIVAYLKAIGGDTRDKSRPIPSEFDKSLKDAYFKLACFEVDRLYSQPEIAPPTGASVVFRHNEVFKQGAFRASNHRMRLKPPPPKPNRVDGQNLTNATQTAAMQQLERQTRPANEDPKDPYPGTGAGGLPVPGSFRSRLEVSDAEAEMIFQAYLMVRPRPVMPTDVVQWSLFQPLCHCSELQKLNITMPSTERFEVRWEKDDLKHIARSFPDLEHLSLTFNTWTHPMLPAPTVDVYDIVALAETGSKLRYLKVPFNLKIDVEGPGENPVDLHSDWISELISPALSSPVPGRTNYVKEKIRPSSALHRLVIGPGCQITIPRDSNSLAAWLFTQWPEALIQVDRFMGAAKSVQDTFAAAIIVERGVRILRAARVSRIKQMDAMNAHAMRAAQAEKDEQEEHRREVEEAKQLQARISAALIPTVGATSTGLAGDAPGPRATQSPSMRTAPQSQQRPVVDQRGIPARFKEPGSRYATGLTSAIRPANPEMEVGSRKRKLDNAETENVERDNQKRRTNEYALPSSSSSNAVASSSWGSVSNGSIPSLPSGDQSMLLTGPVLLQLPVRPPTSSSKKRRHGEIEDDADASQGSSSRRKVSINGNHHSAEAQNAELSDMSPAIVESLL